MQDIVNWLNGYIWSPVLVYCFLGMGLLYTILTRFVQVRLIKDMIKFMFEGNKSKSGVSSFQALAMSVGSRVGVGTVAGVATAIAFGGPGAVFWMWVTALLGGATSFIEITLTQIYKDKIHGEYRGGTPYYIKKGLKLKWFAILSSIVTLIVMSSLWPGVQTNTIALALDNAFGISPSITGIILILLLGSVIIGGVKRIAKVSEIVVPFMAIAYVIVCILILIFNFHKIPDIFSLIITSAFSLNATFGGILGSAISWGVQRGVYANAAGLGSETFESGAAEVSHPAKQGLVQCFSVYIDTFVMCSATAFMILITGMYDVKPKGMEPITNHLGNVEPSLYTQYAIESVFPDFGARFLAFALLFFGFTTLISYYYKSETCLSLVKQALGIKSKWPENVLKLLLLASTFYGSVKTAETAWAMGDLGAGAMAWVNFVALLFLTKKALAVLKDYETQKKAGLDPVFDPTKLGIKDADFWVTEYKQEDKNISKEDKALTM